MRHLMKVFTIATLTLIFSVASNATIFEYSLSNKGRGSVADPDYGLRLDNLFGTGGSTHWTFSFEQTDVRMVIDDVANTAHIFGDILGGIDADQAEWNATNSDRWHLDFLFTGITVNDSTTGFWTAGNTSGIDLGSTGSLTFVDAVAGHNGLTDADAGRSIGLADYASGTPGSFKIGGPNPQSPYVSSWLADTTWFEDDLQNNPVLNRNGACCKDFGFRAARVPEPSTVLLFGTTLIGLSLVRRKKLS